VKPLRVDHLRPPPSHLVDEDDDGRHGRRLDLQASSQNPVIVGLALLTVGLERAQPPEGLVMQIARPCKGAAS
jgi:hypothetical protein